MIGVYVHVPFCERRCPYCDFVSSVAETDAEIENYVRETLEQILNASTQEKPISTIYFGGGTPSFISPDDIAKILDAIHDRFSVEPSAEISIECNPNSLTEEKLIRYRDMKINRISIGVQSFDPSTLKNLGRLHDVACAEKTIDMATKYFDNVSIDLIHSVPNGRLLLPVDIFKKVQHVSAYCLTSDRYDIISDEESLSEQRAIEKTLADLGIEKYEVSNFARRGFECRHNLNYWRCGKWLGFGRGAIPSHAFDNSDRIMMGLRLVEGIDSELLSHKKAQLDSLITLGLLQKNNEKIACTARGFDVLNQILVKLV